jgi:mRNA interferase MazF
MRRGNLVTVALQGGPGKPRPALFIQSALFDANPSVMTLPVTGELRNAPLFCIPVNPTELNALTKPSRVMVEEVLIWWHNGGEFITEICHAWYYFKKYS